MPKSVKFGSLLDTYLDTNFDNVHDGSDATDQSNALRTAIRDVYDFKYTLQILFHIVPSQDLAPPLTTHE